MPESDVPDSPFKSTPPCAGGNNKFRRRKSLYAAFQSTPPCAGGDRFVRGKHHRARHFNPRPPVRGATCNHFSKVSLSSISIHAPLCGGRRCVGHIRIDGGGFQSTPPCAGGDYTKCL